MIFSRLGSLLLLTASSASLVTLASSSSHHSGHHSHHHSQQKTNIRLPWSSPASSENGTTHPSPPASPPSSAASPSPSPSPTPTPSPTPAVTNLIKVEDHTSVQKSKEEIEQARIESLERSPFKPEDPAHPSVGDEITEWLDMHNNKRMKHGLPPLDWDPVLADLAAKWLPHLRPTCGLAHSPATDKFRANVKGAGNYKQAGENLYAHYGAGPSTIQRACQAWIDEEQCYKFGPVGKLGTTYKGPNCKMGIPQSGHYTQFMSDSATHVGCAWFYCGKKQFLQSSTIPSWFTGLGYIYGCEYGNANGGYAGNALGSLPFPEEVARNIGLPFLGETGGGPPPIDSGAGGGGQPSTGTGGGSGGGGGLDGTEMKLKGDMAKFYKVVKGADGKIKIVRKTPEEIQASIDAEGKDALETGISKGVDEITEPGRVVPPTATKIKGGKKVTPKDKKKKDKKKKKGGKKDKKKKKGGKKDKKKKKKKKMILASLHSQTQQHLLRGQEESDVHHRSNDDDDDNDDTHDDDDTIDNEDEDNAIDTSLLETSHPMSLLTLAESLMTSDDDGEDANDVLLDDKKDEIEDNGSPLMVVDDGTTNNNDTDDDDDDNDGNNDADSLVLK